MATAHKALNGSSKGPARVETEGALMIRIAAAAKARLKASGHYFTEVQDIRRRQAKQQDHPAA